MSLLDRLEKQKNSQNPKDEKNFIQVDKYVDLKNIVHKEVIELYNQIYLDKLGEEDKSEIDVRDLITDSLKKQNRTITNLEEKN